MGYHLAVLLVCVDTIIPYFRTTTSSKHQGTIYWNHCQATTHQHTTIHQVPFHTEFHTISKILTNLLITFHVAINITISDSVQKLNLTILCNSEFCIHRYSIWSVSDSCMPMYSSTQSDWTQSIHAYACYRCTSATSRCNLSAILEYCTSKHHFFLTLTYKQHHMG